MSDGSWDLQGALFDILAPSGSVPCGIPVYAPALQDVALPFLEIDGSDTVPADVSGRDGLEETVTLHVWTAFGSQRPAKGVIAAVRSALHLQRLPVPGRDFALCVVTSTRLFADAGNVAWHGVITLRVTHFGPLEA